MNVERRFIDAESETFCGYVNIWERELIHNGV